MPRKGKPVCYSCLPMVFIWKVAVVLMLFVFIGCTPHYTPKPRGYFRLYFPEKEFQTYQSPCGYKFEYPTYAEIVPDSSSQAEPCWIDIRFPEFNARVHMSYKRIESQSNLHELLEDARTFAFNHTVKATAIDQTRIHRPDGQVYGLKYEIRGNAASGLQFYVTDSVNHYLRGALYFNERPRLDSIQPVLEFIKYDVDSLIRSVRWD